MPKNPLRTFGRRKSQNNILDYPEQAEPAQEGSSSFRVIDRAPNRISLSADARQKSQTSPRRLPLNPLRLGKSADDLNPATNRGSGGTTHSGSSGYNYDSSSARHSSTSTLPSSVEPEKDPEDEDLFPRKTKSQPMFSTVAEAPLPPPPSFTTRAARAFSFGSKAQRPDTATRPPVPTIDHSWTSQEKEAGRERAPTASSYASTAIPSKSSLATPELELKRLSGFGDELGSMFSNFGRDSARAKDQSSAAPSPPFHRTVHYAQPHDTRSIADKHQESEPMYPAKAFSRNEATSPPLSVPTRRDTDSPYSFEATESDNLTATSRYGSPGLESGYPGSAPHPNGVAKALLGAKAEYAPLPERYSPGVDAPLASPDSDRGFDSRQQHLDDGDRWARKLVALGEPSNASTVAAPSRVDTISPLTDGAQSHGGTSSNATPRASRSILYSHNEDSLFDTSESPASRAMRGARASMLPRNAPKRMTKAEFERLQKHGSSLPQENSDDEAAAEDEYDDDDELERAKEVTRQRRKQEANMAVYRQQMKKVTGGGPTDLPSMRPSVERASNSAPSAMGIHFGGLTGGAPPPEAIRGKPVDDEDDDIPLGILQAHGFPGANRPPTRLDENDAMGQRRASMAGSVYGGGGGRGLPPFARKLPTDPYFGAGIVNPVNRESLAFGNSSGASVYNGGNTSSAQLAPSGHPGGLVGVIAGEERARAARRGSPNPVTGTYAPPLPLPTNMPTVAPQMPRAMSMSNFASQPSFMPGGPPAGQMAGMPGMPGMMGFPQMPGMLGMPQMPANMPQDQMQQFMQMQMQLMQNMLAIQQQTLGQSPQPQSPARDYLGVPAQGQRPVSSMSGLGRPDSQVLPRFDLSMAQRPATAGPGSYTPSVYGMNVGGGPGPGYTPSIAPSERSNVGMPSRYRPVSMMPSESQQGRTQSMTSNVTLQALGHRSMSGMPTSTPAGPSPTIRVVDKPKGTARNSMKPAANPNHSDEEESGWAEMAKKRTEKKWGWRRKTDDAKAKEQAALSELYVGVD